MAKIEGIKIHNYKTIREATIGKVPGFEKTGDPLTPLTVVIGKNGVGKSTLFDMFGFLSDALKNGVEEACESRGGFDSIRSRGQTDPIEFIIYYRENSNARPITYELAIDIDKNQRPIVKRECLRQRRAGQKYGRPYPFLILNEGKGIVWAGEATYDNNQDVSDEELWELMESETSDHENIELDDSRKLGISTLGALKQHPRISSFRKFIESWYLSYFNPDAVRKALPVAKPQAHINNSGDNLSNVVSYMEREHKKTFQTVLDSIADKIPGIDSISTEKTQDGRLLLCFHNNNFEKPFYASQMSDGTLKLFSYLLLLSDPSPHSFLCIEEPENGLHHRLLEILADEFRAYADDKSKKSQVFITTHQPYFVNALSPEEVWIMEKGDDGFSTIRRASDDELVCNLVGEGLPLGNLWYSRYLDE